MLGTVNTKATHNQLDTIGAYTHMHTQTHTQKNNSTTLLRALPLEKIIPVLLQITGITVTVKRLLVRAATEKSH